MNQTARFALPTLAPGQAQKELTHNEALHTIDALLCPVVEGPPSAQPPGSPIEGQCFVVAGGATGAWAGQEGSLAVFTEGGWRFATAREGVAVFEQTSGETLLRRNGSWEAGVVRAHEVRIGGQTVVRERQAAVAAPSGGATVDTECREAVAAILSVLQAHGLIG